MQKYHTITLMQAGIDGLQLHHAIIKHTETGQSFAQIRIMRLPKEGMNQVLRKWTVCKIFAFWVCRLMGAGYS